MNKITKLVAIVAVVSMFASIVDARMLTVGSTGADVVELQAFLTSNGYPIPLIDSGVAKPGYFGEQTKNAVKMYQEGNEMNPTGSIDSNGYGSVKLGSVTGPDTYFPYTANNNLQVYSETKGLTIATTTVCSIKSPYSTSTLAFASVMFNVASTTATRVTLAKAASGFATTTVLTHGAIAANAQGLLMASSTPLLATGAINDLVFAPNQYFVVGMQGGIGTFSPSGSCSAMFIRN